MRATVNKKINNLIIIFSVLILGGCFSCKDNKRENITDDSGMTVYDALGILKDMGHIVNYGKVVSVLGAKMALFLDGPILIALHVLNFGMNFWKGGSLQGYHAVTLTGYANDHFILKNSWSRLWGNKGYTKLPVEDFNKYVLECWTIIR